jgi:hypothetical protein
VWACFVAPPLLAPFRACAHHNATPHSRALTCAQVCPPGQVIVAIEADFGTPQGTSPSPPTCNSWYPDFSCTSPSAEAVFEAKCLQRSACAFFVSPSVFGQDPNSFCGGANV